MISKILLLIGIACLSLYGFFTVQAYFHQRELERQLYQPTKATAVTVDGTSSSGEAARVRRKLKEGDLFGKLEIPRLNLSVMVMEGESEKILRRGAGRPLISRITRST